MEETVLSYKVSEKARKNFTYTWYELFYRDNITYYTL